MKNILIVKTGAAGDVLRTTFVLKTLSKKYNVYWLTDPAYISLINSNLAHIHIDIDTLTNTYFETIYSLEEEPKLLFDIQTKLNFENLVGCFYSNGIVKYSADNTEWFDMSMVSKYGIERANELKLKNTKTFQELMSPIFKLNFNGQCYNELNYDVNDSIVRGDIAIANQAGNKWPNKNWAYYDELKTELEIRGYTVNFLPNRPTVKEHVSDIASHKLIICGDSLPMHIATALKVPSIALFTCTSPVEIYDYELITKIVSERLNEFYYQREFNEFCIKSISVTEVLTELNM
jgi:heptosyltransferase-2